MMYSNVVNPGASIRNHATRPGMLSLLTTDVLPMPYHEMRYCIEPICRSPTSR